MRKLHGTYVHRGDGARRRAKLRRWAYALGFCAAATVAWDYKDSAPSAAQAAPAAPSGRAWAFSGDDGLRRELATVKGELDIPTAAMAKYWSSERAQQVADTCLQLHGGYGYMEEYPIARAWTDLRISQIYAGTTEIMKEIIARSLPAPVMGQ